MTAKMDEFRKDILERIKDLQHKRADDKDMHQRMGMLEQEQASIITSLKSIERTMLTLADKVTTIQEGTRTNWGVLAAWSSVVILVMTTVGGLAIHPLSQDYREHEKSKGHTHALVMDEQHSTRLTALEATTKSLDSTLQREMRLLDEILQREMQLRGEAYEKTLEQVEKRVEKIEASRFTGASGEFINKRVDDLKERQSLVEAEQRRRAVAGEWKQ